MHLHGIENLQRIVYNDIFSDSHFQRFWSANLQQSGLKDPVEDSNREELKI